MRFQGFVGSFSEYDHIFKSLWESYSTAFPNIDGLPAKMVWDAARGSLSKLDLLRAELGDKITCDGDMATMTFSTIYKGSCLSHTSLRFVPYRNERTIQLINTRGGLIVEIDYSKNPSDTHPIKRWSVFSEVGLSTWLDDVNNVIRQEEHSINSLISALGDQ